MKIIFTKHVKEKLKTKEAKKFKINRTKIRATLQKSLSKELLPDNLIRIIDELDKAHSLAVVYKFEDAIIKVITFFPAEKGRYEN